MALSRDDVRRLAALARLRLSEDEEVRAVEDLGRIVHYVEQLRAVDTRGVPPTTHPFRPQGALRADVVQARITREEALRSAPDADGVFVRVPKVID